MSDKMLRDAFDAFDTDKSGTIDINELKCVVKRYYELSKEKADDKKVSDISTKIMKACDTNGDGKISIEEFVKAFQ
jgi:Ca2+-binding EF-hand superfamily protein